MNKNGNQDSPPGQPLLQSCRSMHWGCLPTSLVGIRCQPKNGEKRKWSQVGTAVKLEMEEWRGGWTLGCIKKPKISQITLLFWYVLWLWYLRTVPKNWTIPTKIEWPQPLFSFGPFKRVKRLKNGSKKLIFKNWHDTRPKMETYDPSFYPTILRGVSRGFVIRS